ncbi:MAG TPA: Bax inhibitor-1/YccA family protein [Gemmatimonadales bacterium]|nr:Bax inhibitor-1/YccA family protein [Gemmatimonadales bacterium]
MANPVLNDKAFQRADQAATYTGEQMSVEGAVNKTAFLLLLLVAPAAWVWTRFFQTGDPAAVMPLMMLGVIGGLITGLATAFVPTWARLTAPVYAVCEGLALGGISAVFESQYPGLVLQSVGLTLGVLAAMLVLYRTGVIKVTDRFRMAVVGATAGIALFYFVSIVLSFFSVNVPLIWSSGLWGIVFSLVVVGVAALNLALDFDFIEQGVTRGAPQFMEWYAAFGLLVTLVWLYLEILRLLAKLRRR